jgi:hypothetical protein
LAFIEDPSGDVARSLRRLADTLDDYMEMSLAAIEVTNGMKAADPAVAELLQPLTDVLTSIRARRASR